MTTAGVVSGVVVLLLLVVFPGQRRLGYLPDRTLDPRVGVRPQPARHGRHPADSLYGT